MARAVDKAGGAGRRAAEAGGRARPAAAPGDPRQRPEPQAQAQGERQAGGRGGRHRQGSASMAPARSRGPESPRPRRPRLRRGPRTAWLTAGLYPAAAAACLPARQPLGSRGRPGPPLPACALALQCSPAAGSSSSRRGAGRGSRGLRPSRGSGRWAVLGGPGVLSCSLRSRLYARPPALLSALKERRPLLPALSRVYSPCAPPSPQHPGAVTAELKTPAGISKARLCALIRSQRLCPPPPRLFPECLAHSRHSINAHRFSVL